MSATTTDAPANNAEVFTQYHRYVKYLIARYGFHPENVEDMASLMFVKFMEKDVLSDYDPNYEWTGSGRKNPFVYFLSSWVRQYLYHYKTREKIRSDAEISLDQPLESGDLWADVYLEPSNDLTDRETVELLADIRRYVVDEKPMRACSMQEFYDECLRHVEIYGKVNQSILAEHFGVTDTSIQNWLKRLRQCFAKAMAE